MELKIFILNIMILSLLMTAFIIAVRHDNILDDIITFVKSFIISVIIFSIIGMPIEFLVYSTSYDKATFYLYDEIVDIKESKYAIYSKDTGVIVIYTDDHKKVVIEPTYYDEVKLERNHTFWEYLIGKENK